MNGIKGLIVAVNDICGSRVTTPVVIGDVAVFVLYTAGRGGIVSLRLRRRILLIRKQSISGINEVPATKRLSTQPLINTVLSIQTEIVPIGVSHGGHRNRSGGDHKAKGQGQDPLCHFHGETSCLKM